MRFGVLVVIAEQDVLILIDDLRHDRYDIQSTAGIAHPEFDVREIQQLTLDSVNVKLLVVLLRLQLYAYPIGELRLPVIDDGPVAEHMHAVLPLCLQVELGYDGL